MAQNNIVCQFCEISTVIKWKCINCDLILCEDCKTKIHSKVKSLEEHDIIDLKEFDSASGVETIRSLDVKNIQCTSHSNEKCAIYCQDCEIMLCFSCTIESHSNHANHKFEKIADVYEQKIQELKDLQGKSDQTMKLFSETETKRDEIMLKGLKQYNEIKQEILERDTKIKNAVTKQSKGLIEELDKLWNPEKDEIAQKLGEIREKKDFLSKQMSFIGESLLSQNPMSIFTTCSTTTKDLPSLPTESSVTQIILSKSRPIDSIENLCSLRTVPELKVIESFQSDIEQISRIITTDDGTNILCSLCNKMICKFELKDTICLTTTLLNNIQISDMAITKQGKLLFSIDNCSEVKYLTSLTPGTTMNTFTFISPLCVSAIHATDKNILIGFCDHGKKFPLTPKSRRGIIVQDYNRRHIRTMECDINNDRIFSNVGKITTNINSDICVIDFQSTELDGRVVMLTWLGSVKWTYNPSMNSKHRFTPLDLVTTSEGFILVTDFYNNAIHMLSIDGDLLSCLTVKHGIEKPFSLNIIKSGKLLVGGTSIDNTAKVYVVEKII